jgi:hypothetical protein
VYETSTHYTKEGKARPFLCISAKLIKPEEVKVDSPEYKLIKEYITKQKHVAAMRIRREDAEQRAKDRFYAKRYLNDIKEAL